MGFRPAPTARTGILRDSPNYCASDGHCRISNGNKNPITNDGPTRPSAGKSAVFASCNGLESFGKIRWLSVRRSTFATGLRTGRSKVFAKTLSFSGSHTQFQTHEFLSNKNGAASAGRFRIRPWPIRIRRGNATTRRHCSGHRKKRYRHLDSLAPGSFEILEGPYWIKVRPGIGVGIIRLSALPSRSKTTVNQ